MGCRRAWRSLPRALSGRPRGTAPRRARFRCGGSGPAPRSGAPAADAPSARAAAAGARRRRSGAGGRTGRRTPHAPAVALLEPLEARDAPSNATTSPSRTKSSPGSRSSASATSGYWSFIGGPCATSASPPRRPDARCSGCRPACARRSSRGPRTARLTGPPSSARAVQSASLARSGSMVSGPSCAALAPRGAPPPAGSCGRCRSARAAAPRAGAGATGYRSRRAPSRAPRAGYAGRDLPDVQVVHLDHVVGGERAADLLGVDARAAPPRAARGPESRSSPQPERSISAATRSAAMPSARPKPVDDHDAPATPCDEANRSVSTCWKAPSTLRLRRSAPASTQVAARFTAIPTSADDQHHARRRPPADRSAGGCPRRRSPRRAPTSVAPLTCADRISARRKPNVKPPPPAARQSRREQRERDRAGVREHVRGVGEERQRRRGCPPRPPRPSSRGSARAPRSGAGRRPCGRACAGGRGRAWAAC